MIEKVMKIIGIFVLPLMLIACGGGVTGTSDNYIVVNDQVVSYLKQVEIADVSLKEPAWVVIYQSRWPQNTQGGASDIIGETRLAAGTTGPIDVTLDRDVVDGELLYAELRQDTGGDFDVAVDPLITQNAVTSVSFLVHHQTTASLDPGTGEIHKNSLIVKNVTAETQSWLVLYTYSQTAPNHIGSKILATKIEKGQHSDQVLDLSAVGVGKNQPALPADGENVVLALYENTDQGDSFDANTDALVKVNGSPVVKVFQITSAN